MERTPKHFGYYLHKDGTPVVVENTNDSVLTELKQNGYKVIRYINDDEGVKKHLSTYNAGFHNNRTNIKPFFPII